MRRIADHLVLVAAVAVFCGPVLLLAIAATRAGGLGGLGLRTGGALGANLDRLRAVFDGRLGAPHLSEMLATSLVTAAGVAVLTTAVSFLAAYAMVAFSRPQSRFAFWCALLTLYFPIEARMLPTFEVTALLGLASTQAGLILPVLPLALGTLVFRAHLKALPPGPLEAARLDGAGPLRLLADHVLPLSLVPILAVGIISFVWGWNQYLWPLVISVDDRHWTVMRGLSMAGGASGPGALIAVLSMLPPLVLFLGFLRLMPLLSAPRD